MADEKIEGVDFGLDIGSAVRALREGKRVARAGWNGRDMYLKLQVPDAFSKMSLPYVYIRMADAHVVPDAGRLRDLTLESFRELAVSTKVKRPVKRKARPATAHAAD